VAYLHVPFLAFEDGRADVYWPAWLHVPASHIKQAPDPRYPRRFRIERISA
jgi:hypothetical protein